MATLTYDHNGDWETITRMPYVIRANSDGCTLTVSLDGKPLRRATFKRGAIVKMTITPAEFDSDEVGMKWNPDDLINTEILGEP